MVSIPTTSELLADPGATHWLKNAIRELERRDPIDAMNDAELLARWARERVAALDID